MSMAIGDLVTVVGACERIVKCPVPRVSMREISRIGGGWKVGGGEEEGSGRETA